jgi:2-phosphosulfolactate phosphatase
VKLDVCVTVDALKEDLIRGKVTATIDVLRASSTIAVALANGCKEVMPQAGMEQAAQLKQRLTKGSVMGGERGGKKIPGYDLGNSPLEYVPDIVQGKTIIFSTTNGSRAMVKSKAGKRSLVVSFLNITSSARWMAQADQDLMVLCSGREGQFSLEDTVCAGMLIKKIQTFASVAWELNDAARTAVLLYEHHSQDILGMLKSSDHGRYLVSIGFEKDIDYCAQVDLYDEVLEYSDGRVTKMEMKK